MKQLSIGIIGAGRIGKLHATNLMTRVKNTKLKVVETGIKHGTVTLVSKKFKLELSTLRQDIETYGRHAKVEYIDDWKLDSEPVLGKKTESGKIIEADGDFMDYLLEEVGVAGVQGSAFGLDGYFRISYATSMKKLKIAMDRIKRFCESLG